MEVSNKSKKKERNNTAPLDSVEQQDMAIEQQQEPQDMVADQEAEQSSPVIGQKTEQPNPAEVLMLSNYVLALRMPGQDACVTRHFREGQVVANPETIQQLIDNQAPIRYLS